MSQPRLSILIPSIPSRFSKAEKLYNKLLEMVGDKDIEILMLTDNKKMTIGAKREALKNISTGKYFLATDDDDTLLSLDELYEAAEKDVDVITFKQKCRNSSGTHFIVTFGLGNEVEHNKNKKGFYIDCKRPPFHVCAWNEKFKSIPFPDVSYSEDWPFVEAANKIAKTEIHIDKVIHSYNFNLKTSEASVESNPVWDNPNIKKPAKKAIVNLVTDNPAYINGQNRLKESLEKFFDGEAFYFIGEGSVGAPPHSENPYAFKIYAIEKIREKGFEQILWLDASVYAVKNVQPVFDFLDSREIFMEEAGHWAGTWTPERVLNYFGITHEEAMKMPMFSAGFIGLDFRSDVSNEFFAEWKEAMLNGMFKGNWSESRHDMAAGSIIANKRGLLNRYSTGGFFFAYIGHAYGEPLETVVFHLQGLK